MVRARSWCSVLLLVAAVAGTVSGVPPARAAAPAQAQAAGPDPATVEPRERDRVLPKGWRSSGDLAWTTSGDDAGLHLLVADSRTGYTWRTAATLSEPGFDTDRWVGQACLTGSGRRALVVYAPRAFTNRQRLFDRGAFAAVVDLADGRVVKLRPHVSLAYFNPGCGTGETAVLTQAGDIDLGRTRLHLVTAGTGKVTRVITVRGQVTSAVPAGGRIVAAAGARLVEVGRTGSVRRLAATSGVPFHLRAGNGGRVAFLDRAGTTASVKQLDGPALRTVATGTLGELRVAAGTGGRLFLTGRPQRIERLPQGMARLDVPASSQPSTLGGVAVIRTTSSHRPPAPGAPTPGEAEPVRIEAAVPASGRTVSFQVAPDARTAPARPAAGAAVAGSPTDPVDVDRACSVPRNDPWTQVYQPHWRQVEWAVDLAIKGGLSTERGPNWKKSGLPTWTPQGMFPSLPLAGGGRVPAQVVLGILAQESNLWQASNHAKEGVTGNPLVGNFYGRQIYNDSQTDDWDISWAEADCGYGVAQVTDGMRLGDPSRTPVQQRAIALDYATNIAAGLRILQQKWNETYGAGLRIGNADPRWLENWYFAIWAYNSGFHPDQGGNAPWGVGWLNNPINPRYPADRAPFLELTYDDARTPQKWPYQEKVLGFAAYPIVKGGGEAGYKQAWWTAPEHRTTVKPPVDRFCDQSNQCVTGQRFPNDLDEPPGPCSRPDLRCWYHQPATWKDCASGIRCGNENLRYNPGDPEPPDETANYPPNCSLGGLPAGALIVDDVATSVPSVRPKCSPKPWSNAGSFSLRFGSDGRGHHPSKVDFHQIGGGFGAHFWFAHTRRCCAEQPGSTDGRLKVTGTWSLGQPITGWTRVLVHMPDHGAHTQQARYDVDLGNGIVKSRVLLQRTLAHRWVSLGAFRFNGTPRVSLSTTTDDGDGSEDVAWDAVAFQRLPAKPRNMVVALGDSYSSGEGASVPGGGDYYRETDNNGATPYRNACHRSRLAWARKATLTDSPSSMGSRADAWDPTMDFHFLACSGAQTENLLPSPSRLLPGEPPVSNAFGEVGGGQYREVSQIDKGFLDEDTTLVTLSIGGNDARFGPVIQQCMMAPVCMAQVLEGDTKLLPEAQSELMRTKVKSSIVTVLRKLHDRAPNARIVLVGYPRLLERNGDCLEAVGQFVGLDVAEAIWLNSVADQLAGEMADAVAMARDKGVDAAFADPREPFRGKAICGLPETIHGIVGPWAKTPGEDPSPAVPVSAQGFHPKPEGTSIYAATLEAALRSRGL
jgi:hypothetical protein